MKTNLLYVTGITPDGLPLIGGLWEMHRQEGFPLDLSLLECRERGWAPDWMEAMACASIYNELPQLVAAGSPPAEACGLFGRFCDRLKIAHECPFAFILDAKKKGTRP